MPLAPFLRYSLNQTNLDVESPLPQGGPNNFPQYNHSHHYSPSNTYLDTHQIEANPNSDFGINGTQLQQQNIFNKTPGGTSLDVENPNPNGGPNRTTAGASNIPSGFYQNVGSTGVITDQNGVIINNQVHQYLPSNKYEDSFAPGDLPANSTF
mgnify:CR=1 FL=1|tara:strand:- start:3713 stop:4171 length:459 start_codon:yes stop_codon:yes gene_type:complete